MKIFLKKNFYKLLNNAFYGTRMESVRNRKKVIKKEYIDKCIKQQSKIKFKGIHESFTNYDRYPFKQIEIFIEKPIYIGFAVMELSILSMYERYYDKLQPYFGQESLQLHYLVCDSFVLSLRAQNNFDDLKFLNI